MVIVTMKKIRTHYDNLNVARNAHPEVIKAAYKALAQKYHPDRNPNNPDAERIMKIINTAYQVLSDPIRRAEHDRWIAEQEKKQKNFNLNDDNISPNTAKNRQYSGESKYNTQKNQSTSTNQNGYYNYTKNHSKNSDKQSDTKSTNTSENHKTNNQNYKYHKNNTPSFWSIKGRMRRTTYTLLFIPTICLWAILNASLENTLSSGNYYDIAEIFFVITLASMSAYFCIFIGIKRLHDCNYRGWWILIPFVNLVICFVKPTQGTNRFGVDPRDHHANNEQIDIESDNSFLVIIIIFLLMNIWAAFNINHKRIDNMPNKNNTQAYHVAEMNIAKDDSVESHLEHQTYHNTLNLQDAKNQYDNAVANINAVWNSLHPRFFKSRAKSD